MLARRLTKELKELTDNPITNCSASLIDNDITKWTATIIGPDDTPYAGGVFKLNITFPTTYPIEPPRVNFITNIYHCNISNGSICLDILSSRSLKPCLVSKSLKKSLACATDITVTSAIFLLSTVTPNTSGFKRLPWQVGQGHTRI